MYSLNLADLLQREAPRPWAEGDNIPWNDPDFSQRMLREHLSQDHDAASRRYETIDHHVRFIHERVLGGRVGRVLDLGCGPGLYAVRLALLNHHVRGIDFSPASIEYARELARGLPCRFELADVRQANFKDPDGIGYDLVMFLFGEFNIFRPSDARSILQRARAALKPGGVLLLEPSSDEHVRRLGAEPPEWSVQPSGLFSDRPHMLLCESFWDGAARAATARYYVVDLETSQVQRSATSNQAYAEEDFRHLLAETGFSSPRFYPSLLGHALPDGPGDFLAITAVRSEEGS
jgi:SAM-dependent methyltransferase